MRAGSILLLCCLLLSNLLLPSSATALDVVVDSLQLSSDPLNPTSVSVDVWLDLATGETAPDLSAFQVAVDLSGPASGGVDVVPPATLPSGAHPAAITSNFTPDFTGGDGPARVSAAAFLNVGSVTIVDGAGLMRIDLDIAASASGVFTLSVDTGAITGTVLADPVGAALPYSTVSGVLTIAEPVPLLPAPLAALALAALLASASWMALSRSR